MSITGYGPRTKYKGIRVVDGFAFYCHHIQWCQVPAGNNRTHPSTHPLVAITSQLPGDRGCPVSLPTFTWSCHKTLELAARIFQACSRGPEPPVAGDAVLPFLTLSPHLHHSLHPCIHYWPRSLCHASSSCFLASDCGTGPLVPEYS